MKTFHALCLLSVAHLVAADYTKKDDVVILTEKNFKSKVLDSDELWMVEFYAPWCGHCKSLEPEWKKAAKQTKDKANFGAVDATVHASLAQKYGVKGYPTIKVFGANKKKPTDYQGGRTASDLKSAAISAAKKLGKGKDSKKKAGGEDDSKKDSKKDNKKDKKDKPKPEDLWPGKSSSLVGDAALRKALKTAEETVASTPRAAAAAAAHDDGLCTEPPKDVVDGSCGGGASGPVDKAVTIVGFYSPSAVAKASKKKGPDGSVDEKGLAAALDAAADAVGSAAVAVAVNTDKNGAAARRYGVRVLADGGDKGKVVKPITPAAGAKDDDVDEHAAPPPPATLVAIGPDGSMVQFKGDLADVGAVSAFAKAAVETYATAKSAQHITSVEQFSAACGGADAHYDADDEMQLIPTAPKRCVVAIIEGAGDDADAHNKHIATLTAIAAQYPRFDVLWAAAGEQTNLEGAVGFRADALPYVTVVDAKRQRYAQHKLALTEKKVGQWLAKGANLGVNTPYDAANAKFDSDDQLVIHDLDE